MNNLIKSAVVAALVSDTSAWSFGGHTVIARIAQRILEKESPQTVTDVEKVLGILEASFPNLTKKEQDHKFVECAIFADEIKYEGGGYQSQWHFTDKPYMDEGGKPSDFNYKAPNTNVSDAINAIRDWFNEEPNYMDSAYYKSIHGSWPTGHNDADSYSIAMRLLIHYVGDQHQPLHSETRLDKEYPKGDRGGNDFNLPSHYGLKELHAVWDRVVYKMKKNPHLPFDSDGFKDFDAIIDGFLAENPVSSLPDTTDLNPKTWEAESFEIASTFSYIDIKEGEKIPDDYVTKGQELAEKRLVTAGYRLANVLKALKIKAPSAFVAEEESKFLQE